MIAAEMRMLLTGQVNANGHLDVHMLAHLFHQPHI
jgi:hypothetical protein